VISGIGISEYGVKGWISAFRLSDGEPALEGTGFELPIRECDESGFAIAVAAREELKVCRLPAGAEMDSNFQYASTERWHRATDLLLPPTVKRRSAGRPPPMARPRSAPPLAVCPGVDAGGRGSSRRAIPTTSRSGGARRGCLARWPPRPRSAPGAGEPGSPLSQ